MTPRRIITAAAAIVTALVVQAGLVTPLTAPLAVSLPAVLVAVIGIEAGPSAGMSVGFSAGLLADLGSRHPAGVLAIAWLLLGMGCGVFAEHRRRLVRSVVVAAVGAGATSLLAVIGLALLDEPSVSLRAAVGLTLPTTLGDAILAVLVVPVARVMLRALKVRAPRSTVAAAPVSIGRMAVDG